MLFLAPGIPFAVKATLSIGAIVLAGSIGGSTHQEVESPELESPQPQTAPTPPPVAGRPQRGNTTDPNEDRNLRRKPDRRFGDDLGPNTDTQTDTQNINGTKTDECKSQPGKCPKKIPTYYEDGDRFPDHARMVDRAQRIHPDILTRGPGGDFSDKNRIASKIRQYKEEFAEQNGFRASDFDPPLDADEYPYASTLEGGEGAHVEFVPAWENQQAGADLNVWQERNVKRGCKFRVKVINVP